MAIVNETVNLLNINKFEIYLILIVYNVNL